jgi:hypothetical protein
MTEIKLARPGLRKGEDTGRNNLSVTVKISTQIPCKISNQFALPRESVKAIFTGSTLLFATLS